MSGAGGDALGEREGRHAGPCSGRFAHPTNHWSILRASLPASVKATARDHNFEVAWAAYETSFLHHFNRGASTLDNNTRRAHLGCGGGVRGDLDINYPVDDHRHRHLGLPGPRGASPCSFPTSTNTTEQLTQPLMCAACLRHGCLGFFQDSPFSDLPPPAASPG